MKLNPYRLFSYLIILFSISTLTYRLWPPINKILAIFIILSLLLIFKKKITKEKVVYSYVLGTVFLFGTVVTNNISLNSKDFLYWAITILLCIELTDVEFVEKIQICLLESKTIMRLALLVGNFLLMIGFFIPECYSGAWSGKYYLGFAYSQHSICCACCILLTIALFYFHSSSFSLQYLLCVGPASWAILESGARTFLISLVIIWAFIYLNAFKTRHIKMFVFPLIFLFASYVFINSGVMEKFVYTSGNTYTSSNKWVAISSGRLDFWLIDIKAYLAASPLYKLIGHGFSYVYELNQKEYGLYIWAHNDIIDVLLSCGILGLLAYIYIIVKMLRTIRKINIRKIERRMLIIFLIFPLLVNGLFGYQHYLYSFIILLFYCRVKDDIC